MLAVTLADLSFRARQFLIAVIGVGVVLGVTLVIQGMASGFTVELSQTVNGFGASSIVMSRASQGDLSAFADLPQSEVARIAASPGVHRAAPLLVEPGALLRYPGGETTVYLAGVIPGDLGAPTAVLSGSVLRRRDEAVVDDRLGLSTGERIEIGDSSFTVTGTVGDRSVLGGIPVVYLDLADAQALAVHGRPEITDVLSVGRPAAVPPSLEVMTPGEVVTATVSEMQGAISSIRSSSWLMWSVAVIIVAALLYVAALERRRDFAVLKALGASSASLFAGLVLEAVIVTVVASLLGIVLSFALAPAMSQSIYIPATAYLTVPLVATAIGMVASLSALRRVARSDPAGAFA